MADEETSARTPGGNFVASAILSQASREKADAFVEKQNELADLQIEDLKRENAIRHWSLRIRHISDVLKLGFELALAFIVIAIAVGLGLEIWAAMHADGLVIEAFNVPPAMADKGLTGQVIASKLLDRLTALQDQTQSTRAPSSFANDWTNDIKVQIPDTGVSLGEVVRFLRKSLGHEMHLSGEMYQTPNGAVLTVRVNNEAGKTFAANTGDLDGLMQRAALAVYARAQPYRYSVYLLTNNKIAEGYAVAKAIAETGPPSERAWGYIGMANSLNTMGRYEEQRHYALLAHQAAPDLLLGVIQVENAEAGLNHEEAVRKEAQETLALSQGRGARDVTPQWRTYGEHMSKLLIAELSGEYRTAATLMLEDRWFQPVYITTESALDLAFAHDTKAAAATLASLSSHAITDVFYDSGSDNAAYTNALVAMGRADWRAAIAPLVRDRFAAHALALKTHGIISDRGTRDIVTGPVLAVLYAHTGEWAKADALLKTLPDDCDLCARAHGNVETIRRNWPAAARWFALVSARSPNIPFADSDWGAMLLTKGDLDGAIAKFESANKKGPHFADPLEMWGEALIAKNRSDLALAKFEEAAKYAPNWGRLHLKWGEALWWSGDKAAARKQFAIGAHLDLSPAEQSQRAKFARG